MVNIVDKIILAILLSWLVAECILAVFSGLLTGRISYVLNDIGRLGFAGWIASAGLYSIWHIWAFIINLIVFGGN